MFLNEELLNEIRSRAAHYDATNSFPHEDFTALKDAGYLKVLVPKAYGGYGLSLAEVAAEQTRLARYAAATALAINMHHVIVGMAKHMVRHGNMQGVQILEDAVNGELLAFGISEPSNDKVLFGSISKAIQDDQGGYHFYGQKVFISMIQQCTRLITFGQEDTDTGPYSIFAYLDNNPETLVVNPNWNTLGMRATQSQNIELKGAYAPQSRILTKVSPGPSFDPVIFGIFANFEILLAATYHGIGKRALELGVEISAKRHSVSNNTTYDQDKDIRWRIADAAIAVDSVELQIEGLSHKFESDFDYGRFWMPKLSAVKNNAVETSKIAVEAIIRACGGRAYYNDQELSRLLRDVYAGLFQPSDQESLHGAWAATLLGPIK
ncbi:acyl-CoA dehydrogenase [Erysipelothrix larvae]|uniref:Acyl-CoA dehydrogenase n=1 Tax=Erysipelothrix larvae TaxID=1514105 RepID=A0A120JTW4_9FIRM|nr:acyl-CoA dehydrogenase family protein [Erysipelothrix larvae]AMC94141.1 acyl-CoA dehydrogenase [Erysipelothrix larvae]